MDMNNMKSLFPTTRPIRHLHRSVSPTSSTVSTEMPSSGSDNEDVPANNKVEGSSFSAGLLGFSRNGRRGVEHPVKKRLDQEKSRSRRLKKKKLKMKDTAELLKPFNPVPVAILKDKTISPPLVLSGVGVPRFDFPNTPGKIKPRLLFSAGSVHKSSSGKSSAAELESDGGFHSDFSDSSSELALAFHTSKTKPRVDLKKGPILPYEPKKVGAEEKLKLNLPNRNISPDITDLPGLNAQSQLRLKQQQHVAAFDRMKGKKTNTPVEDLELEARPSLLSIKPVKAVIMPKQLIDKAKDTNQITRKEKPEKSLHNPNSQEMKSSHITSEFSSAPTKPDMFNLTRNGKQNEFGNALRRGSVLITPAEETVSSTSTSTSSRQSNLSPSAISNSSIPLDPRSPRIEKHPHNNGLGSLSTESKNEVAASTSAPAAAKGKPIRFSTGSLPKPRKVPTVKRKEVSIYAKKNVPVPNGNSNKTFEPGHGPSVKIIDGKSIFMRNGEELVVDADPKLRVGNPTFDKEVPWICSFCHLGPHARVYKHHNHGWVWPYGMGDLYGPYFANLPSIHGEPSKKRETWMHGDCALWAGRLQMALQHLAYLEETLVNADSACCTVCGKPGATIACFRKRCKEGVHFPCAKWGGWKLDETKFLGYCPIHLSV